MVDLDKEMRKPICHDETHYEERAAEKRRKIFGKQKKQKNGLERASHKIIYEQKWIIQGPKRKNSHK